MAQLGPKAGQVAVSGRKAGGTAARTRKAEKAALEEAALAPGARHLATLRIFRWFCFFCWGHGYGYIVILIILFRNARLENMYIT